jgi:putative DNA primase/helicase
MMSDSGSSSVLIAASAYFRRGWRLVPIPQGKKAPFVQDWVHLELRETDLASVFSKGGNIGVILGEASGGLVDVDLDVPEAIVIADALLPVTNRIHGRTSKPHSHRWYVCKELPRPIRFIDVTGTCLVELRSTGQQTVVPPSIHPSGELLRWEDEGDPVDTDGVLLQRAVSKVAAASLLARRWPDKGSRHEAALALHGVLLRAGWPQDEAEHFVGAVALAAGDEEWTSRAADARTTARRLSGNEMATGRLRLIAIFGKEVVDQASAWLQLGKSPAGVDELKPNFTDLGNAKRFTKANRQDIRFCHALRKWLIWDRRRWVVDETGEIRRRAKRTAIEILEEALSELNDDRRKKVLAWQTQSEFEPRIRSSISLAESEEGIPVRVIELDCDSMLLNCQNGTLDLRTGQFREHRREDLITKLSPVVYDEKATCPHWLHFLNRITGDNKELIRFLQRIAGYSLTGDISEHALFLFFGTGANGKTTFLEALRYIWGDYAANAEFSSFIATRGSGVRNDLARLAGARAVTAIESQADRHLAEEVIKQITGGDVITTRYLYSEHFEYRPQFKLFLATNHKPRIRGTDLAIWRRIHLVPFTVTIPNEEQDKKLLVKLLGEASGILLWALEGLTDWQRTGLAVPSDVIAATRDYRSEQDVFQHFIDECCVQEPCAETSAANLYAGYRTWCVEAGEVPLCKRDLGLALQQLGLRKSRSGTKRKWIGIRLRADSL